MEETNLTSIEIVAALVSIVTFWVGAKQYILTWPTNILLSLLTLPLHYAEKLYDRCLMNVIFIVVAFYGWYRWLYGGEGRTKLKKITKTSPREYRLIALFSLLYTSFLYYILTYLRADFSLLGAIANTLVIVGIWMMAHKKMESYLAWSALNLLSIYIFYQKERYFFTVKYIFLLCFSIKGFYMWKKAHISFSF